MENILTEILKWAMGAGIGAVSTFLLIGPKKRALEIANLQSVISTLRTELEDEREQRASLEKRVDDNAKLINIMFMAYQTSYGCEFPPEPGKCPVITAMKKFCDENKGVCPLNY